jgi:uncharacterized protein YndB with AHSA1/START domain
MIAPGMRFEEEIGIAAPPEVVFAVYADVERWGDWDPEVNSASIDGDFASGAAGTLEPSSARPKQATFTITEVVPNESFVVESRLPLCALRFDHDLTPVPEGSRAVHRITISGPLAPLLGRLVGNPIRKGLPGTMRGLKRAAEDRHAP